MTSELRLEPLLAEHGEKIEKLRAALGAEATQEMDDVFLLRYVLSSKGKTANALKRVRKRTEYLAANREWLRSDAPPPHWDKLRPFVATSLHCKGQRNGGPLHIVRAGLVNTGEAMKAATKAELAQFFVHQKLAAYELCDRLTRDSRCLVKLISVVDLRHFSVWSASSGFRQALGDSSKLSESLFPQLQAKMVILHPGTAFSVMFKLMSVVMSKAMVEKVGTCSATYHGQGKTAAECPYVSAHFESAADIPSFMGGTCDCEGGCVPGIPNDLDHMLPL